MKKQYVDPEMKIKRVNFSDIIVTSNLNNANGDQPKDHVDPGFDGEDPGWG